jgi:hypothetical protein
MLASWLPIVGDSRPLAPRSAALLLLAAPTAGRRRLEPSVLTLWPVDRSVRTSERRVPLLLLRPSTSDAGGVWLPLPPPAEAERIAGRADAERRSAGGRAIAPADTAAAGSGSLLIAGSEPAPPAPTPEDER